MNILLLTHTFSDKLVGGEVRISWELARAIACQDKKNKIYLVSSFIDKEIKNLPKNLKVYQAPFCHLSSSMDKSNMLRIFFYSLILIFFKKIKIIHLISTNGPCPFSRFKFNRKFIESADIFHDYHNLKIKDELQHDRKRKNEGMKIFYHPNLAEKLFDKFTNFFFKIFSLNEIYPKNTDAFACRSSKLIDYLKKKKYKSKLVYIPNGVNLNDFTPRDNMIKDSKFTFLFVGKLNKTKGLLYLFKAYKKLKQEKNEIQLILVGGGALSTFKEIEKKANGISDIYFLGEKKLSEIKDYYQLCDCFVMPSLSEGFGIANLEAMASGKPVISTKVGGIVDVIRDKKTGFLIEPANERELYLAMKKILENKNLKKKMGEAGRKRVKENFSWGMIANNLLNLYKELI